MRTYEEQAISLVGRDVYEKLVKGYTEKQWGRDCKNLPTFIIKRIPVRFTYDNNYFDALYQGIPIGGYTKMIERILDGIDVRLGENYLEKKDYWDGMAKRIVYTGPIDEYFNHCLGYLEYRSIRFENEILDIPNFQGNAAVNYTDRETPWTRIIEHKWFEFGKDEYGNDLPKTITLIISAGLFFGAYGLFLLARNEEMVVEIWNMGLNRISKRMNRRNGS